MKKYEYLNILLLIGLLITSDRAQQWEVIGDMPLPVHGGAALVLNSSIYIFGGYSDSLGMPVKWIQVFDPVTTRWSLAGEMSMPRYGFVADRLNDSLVVFCGGVWSDSSNEPGIALWDFQRRAPDLDLGVAPDINFDRVYMTGHAYNNSLFLFGGLIAPGWSDTTHLSFIIRYDIFAAILNTTRGEYYKNITPLPYHHMSVRIGTIVYLIGGVHNNLSDKVQKYNLELDTLELAGNLQGVCAGGQAVTDSTQIYIIGGYNEQNEALNQLECFNPNTGTSYFGPALNHPRKESMAVIYKNTVYVFGGRGRYDTDLSSIEKLDLGSMTASNRFPDSGPRSPRYALHENYPDPFNSTTVISFDLDDKTYLTLDIYSITGQHIKTLARGEFSQGLHQLTWDGTDKFHKDVASNVYIYLLRSKNFVQAQKMVLLR
jgi:hypothetical protein